MHSRSRIKIVFFEKKWNGRTDFWMKTLHFFLFSLFFWQFQVAGPYLQQYEVYLKRLDPDGKGEIPALDAAKFLKKSGLSDELLGKVRTTKRYNDCRTKPYSLTYLYIIRKMDAGKWYFGWVTGSGHETNMGLITKKLRTTVLHDQSSTCTACHTCNIHYICLWHVLE